MSPEEEAENQGNQDWNEQAKPELLHGRLILVRCVNAASGNVIGIRR